MYVDDRRYRLGGEDRCGGGFTFHATLVECGRVVSPRYLTIMFRNQTAWRRPPLLCGLVAHLFVVWLLCTAVVDNYRIIVSVYRHRLLLPMFL